jgi:hypothetical protein
MTTCAGRLEVGEILSDLPRRPARHLGAREVERDTRHFGIFFRALEIGENAGERVAVIEVPVFSVGRLSLEVHLDVRPVPPEILGEDVALGIAHTDLVDVARTLVVRVVLRACGEPGESKAVPDRERVTLVLEIAPRELETRAEIEHRAHAPRRVRRAYSFGKLRIGENGEHLVAQRAHRDIGESRLIVLVRREVPDETERSPAAEAPRDPRLHETAPSDEVVVASRPAEPQTERFVLGSAGEGHAIIVHARVLPAAQRNVAAYHAETDAPAPGKESPVCEVLLIGPREVGLRAGEHPVYCGVGVPADRCFPRAGAREIVPKLVIIQRYRLVGGRRDRRAQCNDRHDRGENAPFSTRSRCLHVAGVHAKASFKGQAASGSRKMCAGNAGRAKTFCDSCDSTGRALF